MRRRGRLLLPGLLLLFLLSACGGEAEAEAGGVYTDWSKLGTHEKAAPLYSRWYEDYTNVLHPLEGGYGTLLPYAGVRLMGDWPAQNGFLYGLVTAEGVVVTDPVFVSIRQTNLAGEPLLLLQEATVLQAEGEEYGYYCNWYVAAPDGQWVAGPLPGSLIEGEEALLIAGPEGLTGVEADGRTTLYTWETLGLGADTPFWYMGRTSATRTEDYLAVRCTCQGEEADGWHYYDLHTKRLKKVHLEPGIHTNMGDSAFSQDGLLYGWAPDVEGVGVLDIDGRWVVAPRGDWSCYITEGYIIAGHYEGGDQLYDTNGVLLLESDYRLNCHRWEGGVFFEETNFVEEGQHGYSRSAQIYDESLRRSPLSDREGCMLGRGWFWDWEENALIRDDARVNLPAELAGVEQRVTILTGEAHFWVWIANEMRTDGEEWVLDAEGTLLFQRPEGVEAMYLEEVDGVGTLLFYDSQENGRTLRRLVTPEGEELWRMYLDNWGESLSLVCGMIYEESEEKSAFYRLDGTPVFCFPLRSFVEE